MRGGKLLIPEDSQTVGYDSSANAWGEDERFNFILAVPNGDNIVLYWQLQPNITDLIPYIFDIYRYENFGDSDEVTPIATDLVDTWTYTDNTVTRTSKFDKVAYKLKLRTGNSIYFSQLVYVLGGLTIRQRLFTRAILRKVELTARQMPRLDGYLLKRKLYGTPCTCIDPFTKEIRKSDCSICKGTGKVNGYWKQPIVRSIHISSTISDHPTFDTSLAMGTIVPTTFKARITGLPPITQYDVWVHRASGRRFYINEVQVAAEINTMPIIYEAVLSQAERKDIIYSVPV